MPPADRLPGMSNRVALDVAAFLDSPQAGALAEPGREEVHKIAQHFIEACYDDLGKAPRFVDGQDLHEALGHAMPSRFGRKDPLAQHVPAVLEAFFAYLTEAEVVSHAFELRRSLVETAPEFLEAVRTGHFAHHHRPAQRPVVNKVAKTGRNDPCFCGSGKKFKKCHGQPGSP